jgi:hypothetical protein
VCFCEVHGEMNLGNGRTTRYVNNERGQRTHSAPQLGNLLSEDKRTSACTPIVCMQ